MKHTSLSLSLIVSLLFGASSLSAQPTGETVVIVNTSVIPVEQEGVLEGRDVVVQNGRVISVAPTGTTELPDGAQRFDGTGLHLMPGLREAHAHVTSVDSSAQAQAEGTEIAPTRDRTERRLKTMLSYGITSVRDLGMAKHLVPVAREMRGRDDLPHLTFAGPLIEGRRTPYSAGLEVYVESPEEAAPIIDRLAAQGVDFVKIYNGVSPEVFAALTSRAREKGLPIVGHIPFAVTTREAIDGGMRSIQHTYLNLVKDCTEQGNRAPFVPLSAWIEEGYGGRWRAFSELYRSRDAEQCRALYRYAAEQGVFLVATPQMDLPFAAMIGERELAALSPEARESCENGIAGQADIDTDIIARRTADLVDHYRELREAGVRIVAGSDAPTDCMGFGGSLIASIMLLEDLGFERQDALRSATRDAALMLGEENGGFVDAGADADLVLLGSNPLDDLEALFDVRAVMLSGQWVGAEQETVAYRGAHIWNGETFEPRDLFVSDGRIVVGRDATREVDLSGRFVVPAYANAHAHRTNPTAENSDYFLANGVFYVWNPNSVLMSDESNAFFERSDTVDVAFSMGGITTPGGHPERLYVDILSQFVYPGKSDEWFRGNAFHYGRNEEEIGESLDLLAAQGAEFVKAYLLVGEQFAERSGNPEFRGYYGIDPALAASLVTQAQVRSLKTAWHVEGAKDLVTIARAGAYMAAHMPGYGLSRPKAGQPAARTLLTPEEAEIVAKSGIILVPTYGLLADDDLSNEDMAQAREIQRSNLEHLRNAGAQFAIGTDTRGTIYEEVGHLASLGVFETDELMKIVLNTAALLTPERRIGCLEVGCEADFLALGENPVRDIAALQAIEAAYKAGAPIDVTNGEAPTL